VVCSPSHRLSDAPDLCFVSDLVIVSHGLALQIYHPEIRRDKMVPQNAAAVPGSGSGRMCYWRRLDNSWDDSQDGIQSSAGVEHSRLANKPSHIFLVKNSVEFLLLLLLVGDSE